MTVTSGYQRRKQRVRRSLKRKSAGRMRLSAFRSNYYIYAQLIDDSTGRTLASASSQEVGIKKQLKTSFKSIEAAKLVGAEIAKRAKAAKVSDVVFDRGGHLYHGRVKALADAAREAGLKF